RAKMDKNAFWDVPYLTIDPHDIGREYEGIIRINSQSGKGGSAFILESEYGIIMPKLMHTVFGNIIKAEADKVQRELSPKEIYEQFEKSWLTKEEPLQILDINETHLDKDTSSTEHVMCRSSVIWKEKKYSIGAKGNGPLDAFVNALMQVDIPHFDIISFHEHSIGSGSNTSAMAYVQIKMEDGKIFWGAGKSSNVGRAGVMAVVSAINFRG
ncbi:MAG: 2-isopropylmalate synthase, partial [Treponema sp.]|nr:2-isopropylmalate synthase [Treponema sp.]